MRGKGILFLYDTVMCAVVKYWQLSIGAMNESIKINSKRCFLQILLQNDQTKVSNYLILYEQMT